MEETFDKTKQTGETKQELVENRAEADVNIIPKYSGWWSLWLNRRKILAAAVMGLVLIGLFYIMLDIYVLQESGERYQEIKDDNFGLKIIDIIGVSLICSVGIMSLWLIVYELKAIVLRHKDSKQFRKITGIHTVLILLLLLLTPLFYFISTEIVFGFWMAVVVPGFIIELILCVYEYKHYIIMPIAKLLQSGLNWMQRLITYGKALFYTTGYTLSVILLSIFIVTVSNFDAILFCILPITLILLTFIMNIFNNEIEKKIGENNNATYYESREFYGVKKNSKNIFQERKQSYVRYRLIPKMILANIIANVLLFLVGSISWIYNSHTRSFDPDFDEPGGIYTGSYYDSRTYTQAFLDAYYPFVNGELSPEYDWYLTTGVICAFFVFSVVLTIDLSSLLYKIDKSKSINNKYI